MVEVSTKPLNPLLLIERTKRSRDGAVVTFVGVVRDNSDGHRVLFLDYEAYKEMAEAKLQEIVDEIKQRWELEDVSIYHRLGRLKIGEASLVVVVCSPHRKPAFEACAYAVDRIKDMVPIWKKEIFAEGGERWVGHED
ncbi:MAG: molybdenum cofactor biosynthesis protein MoaE [Chloroflexi bacterium]|nr:molybdenum cofactor biosynthesis protein MoaE [Chloroflexota bacterium]